MYYLQLKLSSGMDRNGLVCWSAANHWSFSSLIINYGEGRCCKRDM